MTDLFGIDKELFEIMDALNTKQKVTDVRHGLLVMQDHGSETAHGLLDIAYKFNKLLKGITSDDNISEDS